MRWAAKRSRQSFYVLEWEKRNLSQGRKLKFNVAERAFVLVANRLMQPGSEHALARWLEYTYVWESKQNLPAVVNHGYVLGHRGRRDRDAKRWPSKLTDKWRECSEGARVQEIESGKEELRSVTGL